MLLYEREHLFSRSDRHDSHTNGKLLGHSEEKLDINRPDNGKKEQLPILKYIKTHVWFLAFILIQVLNLKYVIL